MKRVKLTNSRKTLFVDDKLHETLEKKGVINKIRVHSSGHAIFMEHGKAQYIHQIAVKKKEGEIIIPKNGNKLNCLSSNLKHVPRNYFAKRNHYDNKTGFRGVTPDGNMFKAQISINGKVSHIGNFDTPEEAHEAYLEARKG